MRLPTPIKIAFSHHPLCGAFESDMIWGLCRGCVSAGAGFVVGAAAAMVLLPAYANSIPLLFAALVLGVPQAISYLYRGSGSWRFATKLVGGIGLGLLLVSLTVAPLPFAWKIGGLAILGLAALTGQFWRLHNLRTVCKACPWQADWASCPGFRRA